MSRFQENFARQEDEQLNYDDIAFFYFSFSLLFVILIPVTLYLVFEPIFQGDMVIKEKSIKNC